MDIRIATNHWGWSWRGIRVWIQTGWGFMERWGIQRGDRCVWRCKLGPVSWTTGETAWTYK